MSSMDGDIKKDILDVRKVIERSTSKVSLRDLEKKGFRKVKVLRSNDIDELIRRAVTAVVAREGTSGEDARISEELIDQSRQELKRLMGAQQAAENERAELEAAVEAARARAAQEAEARGAAEAKAAALDRKLQDAAKRLLTTEQEAAALRRRVEDAEARAGSAKDAESRLSSVRNESDARVSQLRHELDEMRSKLKQVETERRLVVELEVPKLRARVEELEGEARAARVASVAAPAAGADEDKMRAMFRDLLKEVGAGAGAGAGVSGDALKAEFAKLQSSLAQTLATSGGRPQVTDADLEIAKVSLDALFRHDDAGAVQSNIGDVKLKEQTLTSDLKSKLDKLKALRGKGGKENKT